MEQSAASALNDGSAGVKKTGQNAKKSGFKKQLTNLLYPGIILIALFAAWEVLVHVLETPEYILPSPSAILSTIAADWSLLWPQLLVTLKEIVLGFVLAFVVAMILGFVIAHSEVMTRAIYPLLVASQTIPVIAIAPVFLIWFGYGIAPKVVITALLCFFPLTVNTIQGYSSIDPEYKKLFKAYNAGAWKTFRKLSLPAAVPFIMTGVKISITSSVIGATIGEWIGSDKGLGYMIIQSQAQIMTARIFASITLLSFTGIILFLIASFIERMVTPWLRQTR